MSAASLADVPVRRGGAGGWSAALSGCWTSSFIESPSTPWRQADQLRTIKAFAVRRKR
jgi:hypothetical protein